MTLENIKRALVGVSFLNCFEVRNYLIDTVGINEWFTVTEKDNDEDTFIVTFLTYGVLELHRSFLYYDVVM